MKTKIYPRGMMPTQPKPAEPTTDGIHAGRVAGVIVSALLWASLSLGFWVGLFDIPTKDYVAVASIGGIASLVFSFPYLFK